MKPTSIRDHVSGVLALACAVAVMLATAADAAAVLGPAGAPPPAATASR